MRAFARCRVESTRTSASARARAGSETCARMTRSEEVETPSEGVDVEGCVTRARETRRSRGDVSHRERDGVSRETRRARRWVMTRPRDD